MANKERNLARYDSESLRRGCRRESLRDARWEEGPVGTSERLSVQKIVRRQTPVPPGETLAARLVALASQMPKREGFVGYQLGIPRKGLSSMALLGSSETSKSDLAWAGEYAVKTQLDETKRSADSCPLEDCDPLLFDICLSLESDVRSAAVGFGADPAELRHGPDGKGRFIMPAYSCESYPALIEALRDSGAILRYVAGGAAPEEQRMCADEVLAHWPIGSDRARADSLLGTPVRARLLLALPGDANLRQRSQIAAILRGSSARVLGRLSEPEARAQWDFPLEHAPVLPSLVACMLALEPVPGDRPILGLPTCEEPAPVIFASHEEPKGGEAVVFGHATGTDGIERDVRIPVADLCRHVQIIGQTGTGKSTAIEQAVLSAIECGLGLTVIDPHGSTVDKIIRCVPLSQAQRIRVVRLGDLENPVPLCMWTNDDPYDQERAINDMAELLQAVMDPENKGFVGMRFVHIWQILAKAAIARFGRLASFEAVTAMARDRDGCLTGIYNAIKDEYPELAEAISNEFLRNRGNDYVEVMQWFNSKFSRITSSEYLRRTFGAGVNALGYEKAIDDDTVTLISLDSPVLGTAGARVAGSLTLMGIWRAVMGRKHRERTHMVFIDEAQLFQSDPLPRMLGEGRKFGLSLTLCTQHCDALSPDVRYALDANSANYFAFRQSARDAVQAAVRLDNPSLVQPLCRLDALNGIATVSVDGVQSPAFTVKVDIPEERKDGEMIALLIEQRSVKSLVEAHEGFRALTYSEIVDLAKNPGEPVPALELEHDCSIGEGCRRREGRSSGRTAFLRDYGEIESNSNVERSCGSDDHEHEANPESGDSRGEMACGMHDELASLFGGLLEDKPQNELSAASSKPGEGDSRKHSSHSRSKERPSDGLEYEMTARGAIVTGLSEPAPCLRVPRMIEDAPVIEVSLVGCEIECLDVSLCTRLVSLHCCGSGIEELKLPRTKKLLHIDCSCNRLASLPLGGADNLRTLDCSDNGLRSLDVSDLGRLAVLRCRGNEFLSVDTSGNPELRMLVGPDAARSAVSS